MVTKVQDNEFQRWFSANQSVESLTLQEGVTVMYEIDPNLHP